MTGLLKWIFDFVIWVFVPVTLITFVWFLGTLKNRIEEKKHRAAAGSGFWAGVMLSVIFLVYQVGIFLKVGFPDKEIYQGFELWLVLAAAFATYVLFLGGRRVVEPAIGGLLVLIFTSLTLSALLHYLFIRTYNDILLSLILGIAFGILTHFASSPSSIKEFLKSH